MKKIIVLVLVPVLLLMGGCSIGGRPDFSVCKKFSGTVSVSESKFEIDADFGEKSGVVVINNTKNAFNTEYEFSESGVKIKCDEIESKVKYSDLAKGNVALAVYKIFLAVSDKKSVEWKRERSEKRWYFSGKYADYDFKGACDEKGKIVFFSVPELSLYFKIKNFG